jgi:hypothetical protein
VGLTRVLAGLVPWGVICRLGPRPVGCINTIFLQIPGSANGEFRHATTSLERIRDACVNRRAGRARVAGMPVPEVTSLSLGKAGVRALTELLARAAGVICVT